MRNPKLEADEDFREDCRSAGKMDIHPALREPEPERARCRACGAKHLIDDLTEDGVCAECDAEVKRLEKGRIR